jgi:WhiB family transcriptional regulator, redox-sensing transcriptional regulator
MPEGYWWEDAACRTADAELFFTPEGVTREQRRAAERAAKLICARCPVRTPCLDAAFEAEERYGIWGGLSPRERRQAQYAATA